MNFEEICETALPRVLVLRVVEDYDSIPTVFPSEHFNTKTAQ